MPDGQQPRLFNNACGTIEFWVRPEWRGQWTAPVNRFEPRPHRHAFVDFSVSDNNMFMRGPVIIEHSDQRGSVVFSSTKIYKNTGITALADVSRQAGWTPGVWHHVACVWDDQAGSNDLVRVFLDGRRASDAPRLVHPEDWSANEPVMDAAAPFAVQIGARNTGICPMRSLLRALRISRAARYADDFVPPGRIDPDADTTALFMFDGSLAGVGMTSDGEKYELRAAPGLIVEQ